MSGPLDIWRQAAAKWSEVYGQVTESQWERPTLCDEWTVRQLVDHTLSWQAEGGRLIGADIAPGDNWDRIRAAFDACSRIPRSSQAASPSSQGFRSRTWPGS